MCKTNARYAFGCVFNYSTVVAIQFGGKRSEGWGEFEEVSDCGVAPRNLRASFIRSVRKANYAYFWKLR